MVDVICAASNISKGDYGCTVAEVSDVPVLLRQTMEPHSIGAISSSQQLHLVRLCCNGPLVL